MPELPEVEVIRRGLLPVLVGRRIESVDAAPVRLREGIVPEQWVGLVGLAFDAIDRRGKFLLAHCGDRSVVLHLGMSGRLLTSHASVPRVRHTHLVIGLEDGRELRLVDPRRFGAAVVLPRERLATHRALASLGPEALASDAEAALVGAARGSRVPIRNLLLDQTVVAGLGNIYATEALARVGIRPNRRAGTVSLDRLGRLAEAIYEVLSEAIVAGGTTLADGGFQDAAGSEGLFAVALRVYDRAGEPCPSCGSAIRRVVLAGRSSYFCPRCQK